MTIPKELHIDQFSFEKTKEFDIFENNLRNELNKVRLVIFDNKDIDFARFSEDDYVSFSYDLINRKISARADYFVRNVSNDVFNSKALISHLKKITSKNLNMRANNIVIYGDYERYYG